MRKTEWKIWISVLTGLMVGQLFAEGEKNYTVANTLRFGYNDNLYRNGESKSSFFVTDIVDLSYRAALSSQTDIMAKLQLHLLDDKAGGEVFPNLYVMLNHAVSPRVLLGLTEYFRSDETTGSGTVAGTNKRQNYYFNRVSGSVDYILDQKNRLQGSVGHSILRNEDDKKFTQLDYTTIDAGGTWKREILPQRTFTTMNLRQRWTDYENRNSSFEATDLSAGIGHTFNPKWTGTAEAGITHVRPDISGVDTKNSVNPLINLGLAYDPSPRTRLDAEFKYYYEESGDRRFGGQVSRELRLGARHDLTGKVNIKATARFTNTEYDDNASANRSAEEDRMDLGLRLSYKLNRIHFLETGVRHSKIDRDSGGEDWEQNVVDVGWRVELN